MKYSEWELEVPQAMRNDRLWNVRVYRLSLFAAHIGWEDVKKIIADRRVHSLADQLYRALGSISANIAEGFSRSSGKDRARFYEYALGSARESRDWYYKTHEILPQAAINHRIELLSEIVRLLLVIVPEQRHNNLKEDATAYEPSLDFEEIEA